MAANASTDKKAPTLGELEDRKGGKGNDAGKGGKGAEAGNASKDKDGKAKGKDKKAKNEEQNAVQGGGKLRTVLVVCLFWLLLLGTAFILVMFDPTEDSIIHGSVLLFLDPEGEAFEIYYQPDLIELQDRQRELDLWELSLENRESELDEFESTLDDRESDLEIREERVDEILELYQSTSGESGQSLMERVSYLAKALTKTKTATAAAALTSLYDSETDVAVKVCLAIGSSKLGPMLDQMDAETRAELVYALVTEGVQDISDELDDYIAESEEMAAEAETEDTGEETP